MTSRHGEIATIISYGETPHPRDFRRADKIMELPWVKRGLELYEAERRAVVSRFGGGEG